MYLDTIVYTLQLLKSNTAVICINNNNHDDDNNNNNNSNSKKNIFHLCWITFDTDVNYQILTNIIVDHNKIEASKLQVTE